MAHHTYVPATGQIYLDEEIESSPNVSNRRLVGIAPPMIAGRIGNGIHVAGVSKLVNSDPVLVMDALSKYDTPQQFKILPENQDINDCHEIMLLPALLEFTTYSNLHYMFSEVPLRQTNSKHPLPDTINQVEQRYPKRLGLDPQLYVKFDVREYYTRMRESVNDFYSTVTKLDMVKLRHIIRAREIKHEREAFEALHKITFMEKWNKHTEEKNRISAMELNKYIVHLREVYESVITHVAMGARMYQRYLADSHIQGAPVPGVSAGTPGIGPLPGNEYITVIINPLIDKEAPNTIYAVDRDKGALYGQGPLVLKAYNIGTHEAIMITESYQYMITDNYVYATYEEFSKEEKIRRSAFKINFSLEEHI